MRKLPVDPIPKRKMRLKWVDRYPCLSCPFHEELIWMGWLGGCYWICEACHKIYVAPFSVSILKAEI